MSCNLFLRKSVTCVNPWTVRYKAEGTIRIHLQILFRFEEIVRKKDGSGSDAQDIFESVTVKYRLGCMSIVKNQLNLITFFCEASILVTYKKNML